MSGFFLLLFFEFGRFLHVVVFGGLVVVLGGSAWWVGRWWWVEVVGK